MQRGLRGLTREVKGVRSVPLLCPLSRAALPGSGCTGHAVEKAVTNSPSLIISLPSPLVDLSLGWATKGKISKSQALLC